MAKNRCGKEFLFHRRFATREVIIGGVAFGGGNPVRLQSMTTTSTLNVQSTVDQIEKIVKAGGELVRMTVRNMSEAEALTSIKSELHRRGIRVPLSADVHFNPKIAVASASRVDKVRINPGNFAVPRGKEAVRYSDREYAKELEDVRAELSRLLDVCREYGTALRIGVNHGSLSPRIMDRYGDTPEGMVESAMEFLRMSREAGFEKLVISLKTSNTRILVMANRLLEKKMAEEGMNYPLHLGVTEAGEGEDGRIRSAVGIGALLTEGIGDTIRVSLTEDPEAEIPVARTLAEHFCRSTPLPDKTGNGTTDETGRYERRKSKEVHLTGGSRVPVVVASASTLGLPGHPGVKVPGDQSFGLLPDYIYAGSEKETISLPEGTNIITPAPLWYSTFRDDPSHFPLHEAVRYLSGSYRSPVLNFVSLEPSEFTRELVAAVSEDDTAVFVLSGTHEHATLEQRMFIKELDKAGCSNPVISKRVYNTASPEEFLLHSAADQGLLFVDGLADGIWLENKVKTGGTCITATAFSILQSSRVRTEKTEFISCPSCGRTMFDIREVAAQVKKHLYHLKGLKIAVMGCIVNGPGEMADADYGYVGSGKGRITLYRGKEPVLKNIPQEKALEELINLIKKSGDWKEI